ncbi:MAG: HAD family hydrolase [Anaerolineales bacterium]
MPARFIRAVLFDLGNTLMFSPQPWGPVLQQAERALAQTLCQHGLIVDCDTFHLDFRRSLNDYYSSRDEDLFERTTESVLRRLLDEKGIPQPPENIIRAALDAFYAVTQQNWQPEEDALPTLDALQKRGYRLGIVSNAADHKDVQQLVEKAHFEPYMDFIITSAACSYRKPHARIFELALSHWGLPPREVAMVGDLLEADILGARQIGLFGIWITRRAPRYADLPAQPDATLERLSELPGLLRKAYQP